MLSLSGRYWFGRSDLSQKKMRGQIRNLRYNKGTDLADGLPDSAHRCRFLEETAKLHLELQSELAETESCFYEIRFDDVGITRHPLVQENDQPASLHSENVLNARLRIREDIAVPHMKKQLFDNKYGTFFNVYKDVSSREYAMVGVEFKPSDASSLSETGYGRAQTFRKAEAQAMLEALERYATYNMENESAVETLGDILENQSQRTEFAPLLNENFHCVEAADLSSGRSVKLPEQLFTFRTRDPLTLVHETSNGVSLGSSYYEAAAYSLFEFIERDAFLTFWHRQVPLRRIDNASLSPAQQEIIRSFETKDKKVYLFDLRFDIDIPTVLSLVISQKEKPATYVSAAAHPDGNVAIEGALKEAVAAHNVYRNNKAVASKDYAGKESVMTLSDHFDYYARPEAIKAYDFLLKSEETFPAQELFPQTAIGTDREMLEWTLERMAHIPDIYCCELQNRLIRQLGFVVTKVIVPDMQTMYFGYRNQRINQMRLNEAVRRSSYHGKALIPEGEHYDEPHPFP